MLHIFISISGIYIRSTFHSKNFLFSLFSTIVQGTWFALNFNPQMPEYSTR